VSQEASTIAKSLKRHVLAKLHRAVVSPAPGWLDACEREVHAALAAAAHPPEAGFTLQSKDGVIELAGMRVRQLVELAYTLRTAREVTWEIARDRVGHPSDLQKFMSKVPWEWYLLPRSAVLVHVDSVNSRVYHEGMAREMIVDGLAARGYRSTFGTEEATLAEGEQRQQLVATLVDNHLTLGLRLGGEPLFKRAYKARQNARAPLPEHVAASLIDWALAWVVSLVPDYAPQDVLVPFAGSGTFGFEAAIRLAALPPWLWGRPYAMEATPPFPADSAAFIRRHQLKAVRENALSIVFCENDFEALSSLRANIAHFKEALPGAVRDKITWRCDRADALAWCPHSAAGPRGSALILANPPYGARLQSGGWADPEKWRRLAQWVATEAGTAPRDLAGVVLIPSEEAWRAFISGLGARATFSTRHFTHGGLDMRALGFLFARDGALS